MNYTFVEKLSDTSHVYVKDGINFVFEYEETTVELLYEGKWEEVRADQLIEYDIIRNCHEEVEMIMGDPTFIVFDVDGTLKSCAKLKSVDLDEFYNHISKSVLAVDELEK